MIETPAGHAPANEEVDRGKAKILVALDEHSISTELVKYLGKIISGKQNLEACFICLLRHHPNCGNSGVRRTPSWKNSSTGRWLSPANVGAGRPRKRRGPCLRTPSLSSRAQESRRTRSAALFANLVITKDSPTISPNSPKKTGVKRSALEGRRSHGSKKR